MSLLESLGFGPDQRVVVVHVDDVGLCSSANRGFERACESAATCGSVMVPCPGFEELVARVAGDPSVDLGVHLTLNCEYAEQRWPALRDDVPSLLAPDGAMWRTSAEAAAHASPEEVERELRAQIERALESGIDVTHLDAHMGTALHLKFTEIYVRLAREFDLPAFLPRIDRAKLAAFGMPDALESYTRILDDAEAAGLPLFDHFDSNSLHFEPGTGEAHNRARVRELGPGLSYLITHCVDGGQDLADLSRDWRQRAEEGRLYSDGTMASVLAEEGVHALGMRALRDWMRRPDRG